MMKKKIKNLTLEELLNICLKYSCEPCDNCPLHNVVCTYRFTVDELYDKKLNQEIEVEDDDKETPLTPEYKNTKVEREHYLDKDHQMLYHCPKCDWIINPVREYCEHCGQKLDWNKYYVVEGDTYYKRNE